MKRPSVVEAARDYLRRGWFPVPIPPREKGPVIKDWPALRLRDDKLSEAFSPNYNIGLILGEASCWLVNVDLDCPEARELADQYLPPTPTMSGRPSSPRCHRWYIAAETKTTQHRDPTNKKMIVELRSNGGQTVVGPSVHPSGELYENLVGEPATVPAPMLAACVAALAQAVMRQRYGDQAPAEFKPAPTLERREFTGSDLDLERRAIAYLDALPPAISKQGGHAATFTAATAVVHGFGIAAERAFELLKHHYNPRCQPEWSEKELQHKINEAVSKPHDRPFGWLRDNAGPVVNDVDLSQFHVTSVAKDVPTPSTLADDEQPEPAIVDPGPTPEHLLRVPGFVNDVMQYTLDNAYYPDRALAFAGALSLQSLLASRKVRDASDSRTNLYLVALANAGAGKDAPRKTNEKILLHVGMAECLGDEIGSAEGMLDNLEVTPSLLFQTDEIDFLMQAMNQPKESRYQRIMQALLKLFTSANGLYAKRKKVGKDRGYIDQPCVSLFGTAIPEIFYKSLSFKMLTNGWFARLLILESPHRGAGRDDATVADVPQHILDVARWWVEFRPGAQGNLQQFHPTPRIVPTTIEANHRFTQFRRLTEAEYQHTEQLANQAGMAIWARAVEKARKLALIYACSENHLEPVITDPAALWACELIAHQTQRMLYMASLHVSESDFEAKCKRVLEVLSEWRRLNGDEWMAIRDLSRKLRWSKRDHDDVRAALLEQELIEFSLIKTKGRSRPCYRLSAANFE